MTLPPVVGWRARVPVLLLYALMAGLYALYAPAYPFKHEDSTWILAIELPGFHWRVTQLVLFSKILPALFGGDWTIYMAVCQLLAFTLAALIHALGCRLGVALGLSARAAHLGGAAAGFYSIAFHFHFISDVAGSSYRLAGIFAVAALICACCYLEQRRAIWWAGAVLFTGVAAISNSFCWSLPLFFVVLELLYRAQGRRQDRLLIVGLRYVLLLLPVVATLLLLAPAAMNALLFVSESPDLPDDGPQPQLLMVRYLYLMLIAGHEGEGPNFALQVSWQELAAEIALFSAAGFGLVRLMRRRGALGLPVALALLLVLWPALTIPQQLNTASIWVTGGHRLNYIMIGPVLFAGLLLAAALQSVARRLPRSPETLVMCLGLALGLGAITPYLELRSGLEALVDVSSWRLPVACEATRPGLDLSGRSLAGADLSGAELGLASLDNKDLKGADLSRACGTWISMRRADLSDARLEQAQLPGAQLDHIHLNRARAAGINLRGAALRGADLQGADLKGADLSIANLLGADLRGADLRGADLVGADLKTADLRGADLRGARLLFANAQEGEVFDAQVEGAVACKEMADLLSFGDGSPVVVECGREMGRLLFHRP